MLFVRMKVIHRVILLGLVLVLLVVILLLLFWVNGDKPLDFRLYRYSECTFRGKALKTGTTFKEACQKCTCIGNDYMRCETVPGCVHNDRIRVVIMSDKHTLGGMIALMNSIYANTNATVHYHLIVTRDSHDHLKKWLSKLPLRNLNFNIVIFPEEWVMTPKEQDPNEDRLNLERPISFARMHLPRLLPELHGKVIYIDTDCIVQGDIAELWRTMLQPGHLAAFSTDCSHISKRGSTFHNRYASFLNFNHPLVQAEGLRPETCSFDIGVFVTDLELWRHYNISDKLQFWTRSNSLEEVYGNHEGAGGQKSPFLIVFNDKFSELDPFWNVRHLGSRTGIQYSRQFLKSAHLLQWNGHLKPWDGDAHYAELWEKYYIPDPLGEFHLVRRSRN